MSPLKSPSVVLAVNVALLPSLGTTSAYASSRSDNGFCTSSAMLLTFDKSDAFARDSTSCCSCGEDEEASIDAPRSGVSGARLSELRNFAVRDRASVRSDGALGTFKMNEKEFERRRVSFPVVI